MHPEIGGWVAFLFLSMLVVGSTFLPLYLWYVKKIRVSRIYKLARTIRIIFGVVVIFVALIMFFKIDSFNAEFFGASAARFFIAYLLIRRWAPK